MVNLTDDLIIEVLIRLPVKSIIRFRCVCKGWYELLLTKNNLDFVKLKLKHDVKSGNIKLLLTKCKQQLYSIDYDPLLLSTRSLSDGIVEIDHLLTGGTRFLGTCNGLIFACTSDGYIARYIWNPATNESKMISTYMKPRYMKPYVHQMKYVAEIGYGFGYDCGIEDYKVVAVINSEEDPNVSDVGVYTLGSDSWKTISSIPYKLAKGYNNVRFPVFPGVFLNGALHWLAQSFSGNGLQVLLSFDMKDEIFAEIHQPENLDKFDYKFVGVLGGCLCMLCSVGKVDFEVWVMQHYGVRESWTKLFEMDQLVTVDIPFFHYLRRTVSLRNGEILLEIQLDAGDKMDGGDDTAFIVYDPKWERARIVKILLKRIENFSPGYIPRKLYEIDSYVESLVSVNPGSYAGATRFKSRTRR